MWFLSTLVLAGGDRLLKVKTTIQCFQISPSNSAVKLFMISGVPSLKSLLEAAGMQSRNKSILPHVNLHNSLNVLFHALMFDPSTSNAIKVSLDVRSISATPCSCVSQPHLKGS